MRRFHWQQKYILSNKAEKKSSDSTAIRRLKASMLNNGTMKSNHLKNESNQDLHSGQKIQSLIL